jgi:hypothetical protein
MPYKQAMLYADPPAKYQRAQAKRTLVSMGPLRTGGCLKILSPSTSKSFFSSFVMFPTFFPALFFHPHMVLVDSFLWLSH